MDYPDVFYAPGAKKFYATAVRCFEQEWFLPADAAVNLYKLSLQQSETLHVKNSRESLAFTQFLSNLYIH